MSSAAIMSTNDISDHNLKRFIDKTTEILKLSAVQAIDSAINPSVYKLRPAALTVGGASTQTVPSVGGVVLERFKSKDEAVRKVIRRDLGADRAVTKTIRDLCVDVRSEQPIVAQLALKDHFHFVNGENFSEESMQGMVAGLSTDDGAFGALSARAALTNELRALDVRFGGVLARDLPDIFRGGSSDTATIVMNKGLKFRMHEVKCIDETNPEWVGHDEIACGGATVDHLGKTGEVSEFFVRGGFDDGDRKTYSPPRVIKTFSLDGGEFPKTYLVSLALAEKDSNGLSKFIDELYKAIKGEVQLILAALGTAAGAAIGAGIGGAIGTSVGGPLGAIIGIAAGAILGALINWLIGALKDDIFPPQASTVTLYEPDNTFAGGGLVSPVAYLHYYGHGGHYRIKYDWEIVR